MQNTSNSTDEKQGLLSRNGVGSNSFGYESLNCGVDEDEDCASSVGSIVTKKYWYRWYICFIFSLFGLLQGAVWNTWSPIDKSAECAIGFTQSNIDLLTNWGPITFLISMPFFMWLLDKYGLRLPIVLSAFFTALGTGLRSLPIPVNILKYFIHVGQMLNGIAGCAVMAAPPLLSNVWFPPEERVTATSITTLLNYMGTGVAYIIGPLMVQQPNHTGNASDLHGVYLASGCNSTSEEHAIRKEIMNLMYLEFGLSLLTFVCMLIFFPNKPPMPPSASASVGRMDFLEGVKALRYHRTFLVVALTFALTLGGYGGWTGVLSVIMSELPVPVSQDEAGRIGFFMTLAGCFFGLLVGWFADRFKGHIKVMIVVLFSIAFLGYLYYINMSQRWIKIKGFELSNVGLWIDCIIIGIAMNAAVPLGMEMGADAAYPTSEAISASVIVWFFNLLSFTLLLVMQFTDAKLTNYLMLVFIGVSIPLLIFFSKEPRNRMQIDMSTSVDTTDKDGGRYWTLM
uniref:solute carrier family 49 member 4 homolog n=1 Tax=Styela clava TaxID=7725 RepID=UPI0019393048|nr:solute carrier family 49 member 4 homolog [Styela clava]